MHFSGPMVPCKVKLYGGFIHENETEALTIAIFTRFSIFQRQIKRLTNIFKFVNWYFSIWILNSPLLINQEEDFVLPGPRTSKISSRYIDSLSIMIYSAK